MPEVDDLFSPIFIAYSTSSCKNGDIVRQQGVQWFNDMRECNLTQLCQVYGQRLVIVLTHCMLAAVVAYKKFKFSDKFSKYGMLVEELLDRCKACLIVPIRMHFFSADPKYGNENLNFENL